MSQSKFRFGVVFLTAAFMAFTTFAAKPTQLAPDAGASVPQVASGGNAAPKTYAAFRDLFAEVSPNFAISTYSLDRCLAFLALGAKGKTKQELVSYLHTDNLLKWLEKSAHDATTGKGQVTFQESNGVWIQKGLPLAVEFKRNLTANKVTLESLDFEKAPDDARKQMNQKVSDETNAKIPELLPEKIIRPSTRTVLTNAIYFLGTWQHPFLPANTKDEPFAASNGTSVKVPMMNANVFLAGGKYTLGGALGSGVAVTMPYAGSSYALLLVMPDMALSDFENAMSRDTVLAISRSLKSEGELALAVPKFEIRTGGLVQDALAKAGLKTALSSTADYSGITAKEALSVSAVVHQVFIKVDETGTEAAAATAVIMGPGGAAKKPTPLRFDKPFFFAVYNRDSGTTLFAGHVGNPLQAPGRASAEAVENKRRGMCYQAAKAKEYSSYAEPAPAPFSSCPEHLKMHCNGGYSALGFNREATIQSRKKVPDDCCYNECEP
jgi:serpin B